MRVERWPGAHPVGAGQQARQLGSGALVQQLPPHADARPVPGLCRRSAASPLPQPQGALPFPVQDSMPYTERRTAEHVA